jgi:hypothetical protein
MFKKVESDVSALTKRIMLMKEEDKKSAETLCGTVTKLAKTSKAADIEQKADQISNEYLTLGTQTSTSRTVYK